MEKQVQSTKKSKLSLEDFKAKSNANGSKEALEAITGGILGACHDGSSSGGGCMTYYKTGGY
jgi:hypothetical protein